MSELYCNAGKTQTDLPSEAFNKGANISPCKECKHPYHLAQLERMNYDKEVADLVGQNTTKTYSHRVNVINNPNIKKYNNFVICTCNCQIVYS